MEDNLTTQLSENEKAELETLEGIITREMGSFVVVGNALLTIRERKLYREQFRTFTAYCTERWGMGNNYANRLINGSQVATNLLTSENFTNGTKMVPIGTNFNTLVKIQPDSEYQVRPLASLEPEQQREVWEEAVRSADGKVVTFKQVKALVDKLVSPPPPVPPKKKDPYAHSDAHAFVTMAMATLERIRDDDPLRIEALGRLSEWIQEKLTIWTKGD